MVYDLPCEGTLAQLILSQRCEIYILRFSGYFLEESIISKDFSKSSEDIPKISEVLSSSASLLKLL